MKKDKKNILVLFLLSMFIILTSYFLFISGTTNKIKASLNKMSKNLNQNANSSYYPVITMVINSSGDRLVNEDVVLTVFAESMYKIDKVYYSYDKKTWYDDVYEANYGKEANIKLLFTKTMNKTVYVKVENEKGYQSYVYEALVKIDKETPTLKIDVNFDKLSILASDNTGLSSIQYSYDGINWEEENISGKSATINKELFNIKYVRVVDTAGNISDVKKVKNDL